MLITITEYCVATALAACHTNVYTLWRHTIRWNQYEKIKLRAFNWVLFFSFSKVIRPCYEFCRFKFSLKFSTRKKKKEKSVYVAMTKIYLCGTNVWSCCEVFNGANCDADATSRPFCASRWSHRYVMRLHSTKRNQANNLSKLFFCSFNSLHRRQNTIAVIKRFCYIERRYKHARKASFSLNLMWLFV